MIEFIECTEDEIEKIIKENTLDLFTHRYRNSMYIKAIEEENILGLFLLGYNKVEKIISIELFETIIKRKGYGKKIIQAFISEFQVEELNGWRIYACPMDFGARKFWLNQGFRKGQYLGENIDACYYNL